MTMSITQNYQTVPFFIRKKIIFQKIGFYQFNLKQVPQLQQAQRTTSFVLRCRHQFKKTGNSRFESWWNSPPVNCKYFGFRKVKSPVEPVGKISISLHAYFCSLKDTPATGLGCWVWGVWWFGFLESPQMNLGLLVKGVYPDPNPRPPANPNH